VTRKAWTADLLAVTGAVGVRLVIAAFLLSAPLLSLERPQPTAPARRWEAPASAPRRLIRLLSPRTPSEEALWTARWLRMRAVFTASDELEALESWDAAATQRPATVSWSRRLLCADRGGNLHRAREAAKRAVGLAHSDSERTEGALWLALIECEAGHHDLELQAARRLVALRPRDSRALRVLQRAATCNGLTALASEIEAARQEIEATP
jgi:tetratricopeptide (TPR) repeat protein